MTLETFGKTAIMLEALAGATVVTPDLDAAVAAYRDWLGYRGPGITAVSTAQAAAWGAPAAAGARMAVLRPESGESRFLRLIEGAAAPGFRPLHSLGWQAIEIIVQDVDRLAERLADSPFAIIGPPAVLDFDFTDQIKAMQVVGPGGEILYLTEVGAEVPGFDLPAALSFVGQMFIMVLGGHDIAATAAPYAAWGRPLGPVLEASIAILSAAHGLPADHRHRLAMIALDAMSLIEVDAFPQATTSRPLSAIGLPCGIAMASFFGTSAIAATQVMHGAAGEWIEILGP